MKHIAASFYVLILLMGLSWSALAQQPSLEIKAKHPGEIEDKTLRVENIPVEGAEKKTDSKEETESSPISVSPTRSVSSPRTSSQRPPLAEKNTKTDQPQTDDLETEPHSGKILILVLGLALSLVAIIFIWRRRHL